MTKHPSIDDKRREEKAYLVCSCGAGRWTNVQAGPHEFWFDCPNVECRRVFRVEYAGRRPVPELERELPKLALVSK
jgi:hypothetical protein